VSIGIPALGGVPADGRRIGGLDPRLRICAALGLSLVVLGLDRWPALGAALVMAVGLTAAGGAPRLWGRLLVLESFLLVLLMTLPFQVPGEALWRLGPLEASREGIERAAMIAVRANAVVLCVLTLVGGLEPVRFAHALDRLGLPRKLVHLLLLTLRQVHLVDSEYRRLRLAMRARAFTPRSDRHTWRSLGWLIGMLLVRATERSRRVLDAMRCRGFHGRLLLLDGGRWGRPDTLWSIGLAGLAVGLLVLDRLG